MYFFSRFSKLSITRTSISGDLLSISARILFLRSSRDLWHIPWTRSLRHSHRKKSGWVKSGDLGGQPKSSKLNIKLVGPSKLKEKVAQDISEQNLQHKWPPAILPRPQEHWSKKSWVRQIWSPNLTIWVGPIDWSDLTPPDYFRWECLEDRVNGNCPKTLEDLKNNIRAEIDKISPEMLVRGMDRFVKRLKKCIELDGAQVEK